MANPPPAVVGDCALIPALAVPFLNPIIFTSISSDCLKSFTRDSTYSLGQQQLTEVPAATMAKWGPKFGDLSPDAFSSFSVEQLTALQRSSIRAVPAEGLLAMVRSVGATIINRWTPAQLDVPVKRVWRFKALSSANRTIFEITVDFPSIHNAASASWMTLFYSTAEQNSYSLPLWNVLPISSFAGIPAQHAGFLPAEILSNSTGPQAALFDGVFLSALSAAQLNALPAVAIGNISLASWVQVYADVLSQLTEDKFAAIPPLILGNMTCTQVLGFRIGQLALATAEAKAAFNQVRWEFPALCEPYLTFRCN